MKQVSNFLIIVFLLIGHTVIAQNFVPLMKSDTLCPSFGLLIDPKVIAQDDEIDSLRAYFKKKRYKYRNAGDLFCEEGLIDDEDYGTLFRYASLLLINRIAYQDLYWGARNEESFTRHALPFIIQDFAVNDLNSLLFCSERSFLSGSFVGYHVPEAWKLDSAKSVWIKSYSTINLYKKRDSSSKIIKIPFRYETLHLVSLYFELTLFERVCFVEVLCEELTYDCRLLGLFFLDLNTILGMHEVFLNENGFMDKQLIKSAVQSWKKRFQID